jgi:long-subunit fatty acid transport protein
MDNRRRLLLRSLALLIGALLLSAPPATAQSVGDALFFSEREPAAGARLTGMAGAGLAGIGDTGALYANPAGLGYLTSSQLTGSLRTLLATDDASYPTQFDQNGDGSFESVTNRLDRSRTGYGVDNLTLAYKFPTTQGSFVLAVGLNETRSFDRNLDYQGRNQLSSISDFLLPVSDEVSVQEFAIGEGPDDDELFFGQERVVDEEADQEYVVDFDPDGDGLINRPLSWAAFQTFGIDFSASTFRDTGNEAASFLPVVAPGTQFLQDGGLTEEGTLRELNFASAVEVAENVMLGGTANIAFGQYESSSTFREIDDRNENDGSGITTDFQSLRLTRTQTTDLSGFNLRLGLSAALTPSVRAGFTIETPTWYNVDDETSFVLETAFDDGDRCIYGNGRSEPSCPIQSTTDETSDNTRFEYRIRTPWRFGTGGSVQIADLRLLADLVFVDWTQLRLRDVDDTADFSRDNETIEDLFDPVLQTRLGVEYGVTEALTLRAGGAYLPAPVSFSEISQAQIGTQITLLGAAEVDDRDRTYVSAGFSFDVSDRFRIDGSWMLEQFEDRTLPYTVNNASFVNEDVTRNQFQIGATYRF